MEGLLRVEEFRQCGNPSCQQKTCPKHRCGRCRSVFYCGANCQRRHYTEHQEHCFPWEQLCQGQPIPTGVNLGDNTDPADKLHPCGNPHCHCAISDKHVQLDCGHFLSWKCANSLTVCPQCHKLNIPKTLPSRLDQWIHQKANTFWKASQHAANEQQQQALCQATYQCLRSMPTYAQALQQMPLLLHDPDVYWRCQTLLTRACIALHKTDEAETMTQQLTSICGGNSRDPNAKYAEAHLLCAMVYQQKGETINVKRELQPLVEAFRKRKLQVDPLLKIGIIVTLYQTNEILKQTSHQNGLVGLLEADKRLSREAGLHRTLATWYTQKQDWPAALQALQKGLANENRWDRYNRHENRTAYVALMEQIRAENRQREEENAFFHTWGSLGTACRNCNFEEQPSSWSDWRALQKMEGGYNSDEDDDDDDLIVESGTTLSSALQKALENVDESEGDDLPHLASENIPGTSNEMDDAKEKKEDDEEEDDEVLSHVEAVTSVKLTNDVLKWLKNADARFRGLFVKKIERLMRGERSHKLSKGLEGCESKIFETYLENKSGHRILWTQEPETGILIWYVSAHKKVSRYAALIDDSEKRSARPLTDAMEALDFVQQPSTVSLTFERGRVYLDPKKHVPLKLYDVQDEDMERLEGMANWQPSLYLTPREREIVETPGTVCVLGRSGTGKTSVVSSRIQYDRHISTASTFSQLFIARSRKVCSYVKETVGVDGTTSSQKYWTYEKFLTECEKALGIGAMTEDRRSNRVDFARFKAEFVRSDLKMDPLIVWTQIRSFIKGSIQSVTEGRPLTRDEYLGLGEKQNRLPSDLRQMAYDIFESYNSFMKEKGLWDDTDRVSSIVVELFKKGDVRHELKHSRLYVDEVQDFTQAEVAMFFQCCDAGSLFLAGDPAQAVEEGVDFRFEDIRMVAHKLFQDRRNIPEKPKLLKVNFRSHTGVLNLAAGILDIMFKAFPGSAKELPKDEGLFRGPRPALFRQLNDDGLRKLIEKQEGAVILTMNKSTVSKLQKKFGEETTILSIRDSKGLEFDHVILVDFFSDLSVKHQQYWKEMIKTGEANAPELELQLKQLYTAITRCCKRFLIAESAKSAALATLYKWATHQRSNERSEWLLDTQDIETVEETVMTRDEWMTRGLMFTCRAEEEADLEEQTKWLQRSLGPFTAAGSDSMKNRVETHLRSVQLRQTLAVLQVGSGLEAAQTNLREISLLLKKLTEVGLAIEATKLCRGLLHVLDDEYEMEKHFITRDILARLPKPEDQ